VSALRRFEVTTVGSAVPFSRTGITYMLHVLS
jgi:hypothetical protein